MIMIFDTAPVHGSSRSVAAFVSGKLARCIVVTAVALGLVTASAFGATIQTQESGRWSDPSIWQGGIVPGSSDIAILGRGSDIIYDGGAGSGGSTGGGSYYDLGSVGTIDSSGDTTVLSLERNLRVRFAYLPDTTIRDGGYDFIVRGTLINGQGIVSGDVLVGKPSPNSGGGSRVGEGGNLHVDNLVLLGASQYTFYPGDTITRSYNTGEYKNKWPHITVTQDPRAYGYSDFEPPRADRLDQGLSFDFEGPLVLGKSATDQAEIILNWDPDRRGRIDWTLRWKGSHADDLKRYYSLGQIKIGTVPDYMAFKPEDNIFYDGDTGYTYVGFKPPAHQSRVFVTSRTSTGNLGGLTGADAACQSEGKNVDPKAAWIAWLSTSTVNAIDRLTPGSGPFVRARDGKRIADNIADLTDPTSMLTNKIAPDGTRLEDWPIWTGTAANGTAVPGANCGDWTREDLVGTMGGYWTNSTPQWTASSEPPVRCSFLGYLYCFEVVQP